VLLSSLRLLADLIRTPSVLPVCSLVPGDDRKGTPCTAEGKVANLREYTQATDECARTWVRQESRRLAHTRVSITMFNSSKTICNAVEVCTSRVLDFSRKRCCSTRQGRQEGRSCEHKLRQEVTKKHGDGRGRDNDMAAWRR
jgi:hypothetical protein